MYCMYLFRQRVNRKAWSSCSCISTSTKPKWEFQILVKNIYFTFLIFPRFVEVKGDTNFMGLVIKEEPDTKVKAPGQQCFPLFSFIKALDSPTVNLLRWSIVIWNFALLLRYLSLDIEGGEFGVLKTVPWDKVDIEVLLIELIHAGHQEKGSRDDVHKFLFSKNYFYLGTICKIFKL